MGEATNGLVTARVGRIALLPGEMVRATLELDKMTLTVTDQRVLAAGEERRLWFLDGPRATRAVFLDDVSVVSVASKFLPDWLVYVGATFVLFGLLSRDSGNVIAMLIGAAAIGVWYFVKTDTLEVKADSQTFALIPVRTSQSAAGDAIDRFVDNVFRAKAARHTQEAR